MNQVIFTSADISYPTLQVHPKKLSNALWEYSQQSVGSKLVIGKVVEALLDKDGAVCGVILEDGSTIDADALVIACGPWTEAARNWFGPEVKAKIPRMMGVKVRQSSSYTK
jgi:glycine/D-amino acid oxidase-like deaminating enzyme